MIAELVDGAPKVARFDGRIALYELDGEENHGFLFPPGIAVEVATRLLTAVADLCGEDAFAHRVDAMRVQLVTVGGREPEGLLTFRFNGAPVSATIDATQLAQLAAALSAAARSVDRNTPPPRRDR